MCQSKAQGGKRCYAHARPDYDRAVEALQSAETQMRTVRRSHPFPGQTFQQWQQGFRYEYARAGRALKTATDRYEKAAGELATTPQGGAELRQQLAQAEAAGDTALVARRRHELALGARMEAEQAAVKACADENKQFMVKGAKVVTVTHHEQTVGHVVVGPAEGNNPVLGATSTVASGGRVIGTVCKTSESVDLNRTSSLVRRESAARTVWRAETTLNDGRPWRGGACDNRNEALQDLLSFNASRPQPPQ